MRVFVFGFRASQKWIRRNLKSTSCGPSFTSLKNITLSSCAEERAVEAFDFIRMADETADFLLGFIATAEEALDFPFGFADAEDATVFFLVLRSLEIEECPLGSIATIVWEKIFNFDRLITQEKRFINRQIERKMKRIHWMKSKKVWLEQLVEKVWDETDPERRVREEEEVEEKNGMIIEAWRGNDRQRTRRSPNNLKKCKIRSLKPNKIIRSPNRIMNGWHVSLLRYYWSNFRSHMPHLRNCISCF